MALKLMGGKKQMESKVRSYESDWQQVGRYGRKFRATHGDRHYCCECGRKVFEKFMHSTGNVTRWRQKSWACNRCGEKVERKEARS